MERAATFDGFRPQLFSLAYSILGSRADAEDIVQDSFLRWQSAADVEVRSPRSYLMTIVARLARDLLKSAHRKRELYVGPWLPEPLIERAPDSVEFAESLSIAFLHVLESLSPVERTAFLLREIFDVEYDEISAILETSEANCRQLVTRARKHLKEKRPRFKVPRERVQTTLNRFITACISGDMTGLLQTLADDVIIYTDGGGKRSAALNPIYGADRVSRFLMGVRAKSPSALRGYPAEINGAPGFIFTLDGHVDSTITIDLNDEGRIRAIYSVVNPDKLPSA